MKYVFHPALIEYGEAVKFYAEHRLISSCLNRTMLEVTPVGTPSVVLSALPITTGSLCSPSA